MSEAIHPLFETPIPDGWKLVTVDDIKSPEKSSCVAGPFGSNISSKYFVDSGVPIIRGGNLRDDLTRFVPKGFAFVSEEQAIKYKAQHVHAGDLVFTCWGTIGQVGLIPKNGPFNEYIISNKQLKLRPNLDLSDPEYLFFYFAGPKMVQHILGKAIGAAVPGINLGILKALPVVLPPLPVQRRIAGILSAYDDLIENCQQRIENLESMARALYREWFVDFRFPGYETVARVPSPLGKIPKGWEVKEMQEVAEVVDCLHSKKPSECVDGAGVLLQLNNIGEGGKLDMREKFRISAKDYDLWTSRIELRPGDCVITNVGRVAAVAQISDGLRAAPGRNMTAVRVRPGKLTPTFLIEYLLSAHMESEVAKKKDLGTIMDSLNVKGIIRLHVPCPPLAAMEQFEASARPIRRRIELLIEQIQNLRRTRDLLLPRLLSGQIDVETIAA
jgi:type I restriction enzyme S subunit